jgi:hypothetical protein
VSSLRSCEGGFRETLHCVKKSLNLVLDHEGCVLHTKNGVVGQ